MPRGQRLNMPFIEDLANDKINIEEILNKALERHTPMSVVKEPWYGAWACPVCHKIISNGKYCKWCGQRIEFPEGTNNE